MAWPHEFIFFKIKQTNALSRWIYLKKRHKINEFINGPQVDLSHTNYNNNKLKY